MVIRSTRWPALLALVMLPAATACGSDIGGRAGSEARMSEPAVDLALTGELVGRITQVQPYEPLGCNTPTPHEHGRVWAWLAELNGETYQFILSAIPYHGPGEYTPRFAIRAPRPEGDTFLYWPIPDAGTLTVEAGDRSGTLAIDLVAASDAAGGIPEPGTRKAAHIEGRWACP